MEQYVRLLHKGMHKEMLDYEISIDVEDLVCTSSFNFNKQGHNPLKIRI